MDDPFDEYRSDWSALMNLFLYRGREEKLVFYIVTYSFGREDDEVFLSRKMV